MHVQKRWEITQSGDIIAAEKISKAMDLPLILADLLVQRGIDTVETAEKFFNPKLEYLHDPFLMQDMMTAVLRIDKSIREKERVMIYGDYDVDGTTAVALVYLFLKQFLPDTMFYIPDRYAEGYGISEKSIDYANENNVKLIITLDCGIKAVSKVEYAKKYGIDFIVSDHHLPSDELPKAVAVLDPKRDDCNYPFKELSGCGVGFKLVQAICMHRNIDLRTIIPLLDLVVVSIASDLVPIVGENRVLAHYGLKQLNTNPNKGLKAIIQMSGLERHPIQIDDIIFKIGPRINAAGRMEIEIDPDSVKAQSGGRTAVKLLTATDDSRAITLVNTIDQYNEERKKFDRENTRDAHKLIDKCETSAESKCTVIYNSEWQKGVVGIVASRLIETYYKPTVVLTLSNGFITGSARSIPGFDLYQAIDYCSDLLENFGGHTYAAGMTMKPENLEKFKAKFEQYVEANIDPKILIPQINIDQLIELSDITLDFRRGLQRLQPFGPGNTSPIFASYKVSDTGSAKKVGENLRHLKMELGSAKKSFNPISAIAFGQVEYFDHIKRGGSIDICYSLVENHHQGVIKAQLRIFNIRPSE